MEAAHVQGGQQRAGLGQRRCGQEREALVDPVPLSTAKNKENGEADEGQDHLSILLRGGAAEGGHPVSRCCGLSLPSLVFYMRP